MAKLRYESPKKMEDKINEYFDSLKGEHLLDQNGEPVIFKGRLVYQKEPVPPTVCGLALFLGLKSRQSLLNYQKRSEKFDDVVSRAKLRIEAYAESRLYDRDGSRGAQFTLENNFGWKKEDPVQNSDGNNLVEAIIKSAEELNNHEL